jgi:hypothetical protein
MRRMRAALAAVVFAGCASGSSPLTQSDAPNGNPHDDAAMIDAPPPHRDAAQVIDTPIAIDAAIDAFVPDAFVPKDAPPVDACVPVVSELLTNPVFDLTPTGTGWTEQPIQNLPGGPYPIITSDGFGAQSVPFKAWLGGAAGSDASPAQSSLTDVLYQDVTIPANTTVLAITGFFVVGTTETAGTGIFDTGTLDLIQTNGTPIENVMSLNNTTTTADWTAFNHTFAASLSGQTVRLRATSTNDITNNSNFFFDTLSLKATHGCP